MSGRSCAISIKWHQFFSSISSGPVSLQAYLLFKHTRVAGVVNKGFGSEVQRVFHHECQSRQSPVSTL